MKNIKSYQQFINESKTLNESARGELTLGSTKTGLPMLIKSSTAHTDDNPEFNRYDANFAKIKVQGDYSISQMSDKVFYVTIEDEPRILGDTGEISDDDVDKVVEFVKMNKEALKFFWRTNMDAEDNIEVFIDKIQKV